MRVQCGRSLARIHTASPALRIDDRTVIAAILAELSRESAEWERHRPMLHAEDEEAGFLDEHVRQRAHQGLAHVFALLSTILPAEPLRIACRGLHMDDSGLRGTALEYLETVLPKEIREALWPFIGDGRLQPSPVARRTDALTRLVDCASLDSREPGAESRSLSRFSSHPHISAIVQSVERVRTLQLATPLWMCSSSR